MSTLTGVPELEIAVLRAIRDASSALAVVRTADVLATLDHHDVIGQRAGRQVLFDLIARWGRHLPLVAGGGNWGSQSGDPPADAEYTEVTLTAFGEPPAARSAEICHVLPRGGRFG